MNTLSYHIVVRTPAGVRIGDIFFDFTDEKVSGRIKAPFFEPEFHGIINKDDTFRLFITLDQNGANQEYECTGRISAYSVHISVPTEDFTYEIDGTTTRAI